MEEKVIIRGKFSKTNGLMIVLGVLAAISAIIGFVQLEEYTAYHGFNIYGRGNTYPVFSL